MAILGRLFFSISRSYHLPLPVTSAGGADAVGQARLAAGTVDDIGCWHPMMRTTHIFFGLGCFLFWYSHNIPTPFQTTLSCSVCPALVWQTNRLYLKIRIIPGQPAIAAALPTVDPILFWRIGIRLYSGWLHNGGKSPGNLVNRVV